MLLECCSQERTSLRYYSLLGQRFCMIDKVPHSKQFLLTQFDSSSVLEKRKESMARICIAFAYALFFQQVYQQNFDECFVKQYQMIHRLETNKLRNVAKVDLFFFKTVEA